MFGMIAAVGAVCDRASFLPELHGCRQKQKAVTDRAYIGDVRSVAAYTSILINGPTIA